jgi:hypothetical protein
VDRWGLEPDPVHRPAQGGVVELFVTAAAELDLTVADRRDLLQRAHRVGREQFAHGVELKADRLRPRALRGSRTHRQRPRQCSALRHPLSSADHHDEYTLVPGV